MGKRKRGGDWKYKYKYRGEEEEKRRISLKVQKGKMPGGGELTSHLQATVLALLYCQHSTILPWSILYLLWSTEAGVLGFIFYLLWNVLQWIGPNRSKGTTRMSCPQYTSPLSSQKPLLYPKLHKIRFIVFTFFQINCRIFVKLPHESDRDQRIRPPAVLFAPLSTVSPILSSSSSRSSSSLTSSS